MTKKPVKKPNLEESMTEITQLIEQMEHGELTLEQSLAHFERGVTLVKYCQNILESAEQKVQILLQKNNHDELMPYGNNNNEEESNDDDK